MTQLCILNMTNVYETDKIEQKLIAMGDNFAFMKQFLAKFDGKIGKTPVCKSEQIFARDCSGKFVLSHKRFHDSKTQCPY